MESHFSSDISANITCLFLITFFTLSLLFVLAVSLQQFLLVGGLLSLPSPYFIYIFILVFLQKSFPSYLPSIFFIFNTELF